MENSVTPLRIALCGLVELYVFPRKIYIEEQIPVLSSHEDVVIGNAYDSEDASIEKGPYLLRIGRKVFLSLTLFLLQETSEAETSLLPIVQPPQSHHNGDEVHVQCSLDDFCSRILNFFGHEIGSHITKCLRCRLHCFSDIDSLTNAMTDIQVTH